LEGEEGVAEEDDRTLGNEDAADTGNEVPEEALAAQHLDG
jgi:hypothetical protein